MAEVARELEQEQKDREAVERSMGAIESVRFLREHLHDADGGFSNTPENGKALFDFLMEKKLQWTRENLNAAYAALKAAGRLTQYLPTPETMPTEEVAVAPSEPPAVPDPIFYPWGELTIERVMNFTASEMSKWMRHREYGAEFTKQVNALQIPQSEKWRGL